MNPPITFVGTVGFEISLDLAIDITAVGAVLSVRAQKPSGAAVTWTASIVDGASGLISYTTILDDLDEAGTWRLQGVYNPTGDEIYYGATTTIEVKALGAL
jgi:hypothetical protein